jgi:hypothetical protein
MICYFKSPPPKVGIVTETDHLVGLENDLYPILTGSGAAISLIPMSNIKSDEYKLSMGLEYDALIVTYRPDLTIFHGEVANILLDYCSKTDCKVIFTRSLNPSFIPDAIHINDNSEFTAPEKVFKAIETIIEDKKVKN